MSQCPLIVTVTTAARKLVVGTSGSEEKHEVNLIKQCESKE